MSQRLFTVALCALSIVVLAHCTRAPAEPPGRAAHERSASAARVNEAVYQPPLDESARRVRAALAERDRDAAVVTSDEPARRIGTVPSLPPQVDLVAVRVGSQTHTALVERDHVLFGLEAAARVLAIANNRAEPPDGPQLARLLGALYYPNYAVFDGTDWSSPLGARRPSDTPGAPSLEPRPGGGRTLLFTYAIPDGLAGAGPHLGNFRLTDSGLIIDLAPSPTRR